MVLSELVPADQIGYAEFDGHKQKVAALSIPAQPPIKWFVSGEINFRSTSPSLGEGQLRTQFSPGPIAPGRFEQAAFWKEYYRRDGTTRQLQFVLDGTPDTRIGLALNRDARDFSQRDRGVLAFILPHMRQAWQNVQMAADATVSLERVGEGLGNMRRAVMLADANGGIRWQSPLAVAWLNEFFPKRDPSALPAELESPLAEAEPAIQAGRPFFYELPLPPKTGCRLLMYCGKTEDGGRVIALMRERTGIDADMTRGFGLTPREADVLFWISEAKTNPEIAAITGVSLRTIHKHVEHLFAKLGVENRLQAQRLGLELRRM
jgi:DNA-binding CsgD family transcriptional regulator